MSCGIRPDKLGVPVRTGNLDKLLDTLVFFVLLFTLGLKGLYAIDLIGQKRQVFVVRFFRIPYIPSPALRK